MISVYISTNAAALPLSVIQAQSTVTDKTKTATPAAATPAVIVALSDTAQQALAERVKFNSDSDINNVKPYLVDLSTRNDELVNKTSLTSAEKAEALALNSARNAREEKAFVHFAREAGAAGSQAESERLFSKFYSAYIEYYDTLSPQEQNTQRYRGTREGAFSAYKTLSASAEKIVEPQNESTKNQDYIVSLFDKISKNATRNNLLNTLKSPKVKKQLDKNPIADPVDLRNDAGKSQTSKIHFKLSKLIA